jgi:hypothetical protein
MKRLLCIAILFAANPVFAQQVQGDSMLQQYLRAESGGYAPPVARPVAPPVAVNPYATAYQQPQAAYAPPPAATAAPDDSHHLNKGVAGMNF